MFDTQYTETRPGAFKKKAIGQTKSDKIVKVKRALFRECLEYSSTFVTSCTYSLLEKSNCGRLYTGRKTVNQIKKRTV